NITGEPLLSKASRLYNVDFNLRAGGIQHIATGEVGTMITDIIGSEEAVAEAISFLSSQGVVIEEA
ncbi:MAG: NIL domain-containing protein, partial [Spirochaetaceae bacterium]|nr:NIL domain-containing protein [Spirochaetaceae bacterium]